LIREHKLTNEFERGRIISSGVWLTDGQTRIAGIGVGHHPQHLPHVAAATAGLRHSSPFVVVVSWWRRRRAQVTRVLGDHFAKDTNSGMLGAPDSSPAYLLTPHDTHLIVASDGVRFSFSAPSPSCQCWPFFPQERSSGLSTPQLWDVMSPATAGDLVAKEETAEAGARVLMKRALASAKCKDNVTIVVVRL
jgi:serine/threonine protein phosphatase PrpC